MDLQKALQNLGGLQQVAALHSVAVFLIANLPIRVDRAPAVGKVGENPRDLAVPGHPPQPDIGGVRKRHQYGHAVAAEPQQVELLKSRSKRPGTDILNDPDPLIRIDDFVSDAKRQHTGPPTSTCTECSIWFAGTDNK